MSKVFGRLRYVAFIAQGLLVAIVVAATMRKRNAVVDLSGSAHHAALFAVCA